MDTASGASSLSLSSESPPVTAAAGAVVAGTSSSLSALPSSSNLTTLAVSGALFSSCVETAVTSSTSSDRSGDFFWRFAGELRAFDFERLSARAEGDGSSAAWAWDDAAARAAVRLRVTTGMMMLCFWMLAQANEEGDRVSAVCSSLGVDPSQWVLEDAADVNLGRQRRRWLLLWRCAQ